MAGIYIHIPFCKSRCRYCDFYSTTLLEQRAAYVDAVVDEYRLRVEAESLWQEQPDTVYIGGGTPSVLSPKEIHRLLQTVCPAGTESVAEITMEANPGDLTPAYLSALRRAGVNRLSVGIQSFSDERLQLIGRRHTAQEAIEAVRMAQEVGFDNLSVDLIYGLPGQSEAEWQHDMDTVLRLGVQHVSAYSLMYEEGTVLTRMLREGQIAEVDDETELRMYDKLTATLQQHGYEHYEVSNYALPGYRARHNSSYWTGVPYLGLGAGAHSYSPRSEQHPQAIRSWNTASLSEYMQSVRAGIRPAEEEVLSEDDLYNEYVMLGLRTQEGIRSDRLKNTEMVEHCLQQGLLEQTNGRIYATQQGYHILNSIIQNFMI